MAKKSEPDWGLAVLGTSAFFLFLRLRKEAEKAAPKTSLGFDEASSGPMTRRTVAPDGDRAQWAAATTPSERPVRVAMSRASATRCGGAAEA